MISLPTKYDYQGNIATLAEHLGYSSNQKLLIIGADDFGFCDSVNQAIYNLSKDKKITSTSIMPPAFSYQDALRKIRKVSAIGCGVHITLTMSFTDFPMLPIAERNLVTSLQDENGDLFAERDKFFMSANPVEAKIEAIAQIEKALDDSITLTHIDSHEGTLQLQPEFAKIYLELAVKYKLPLRMGSPALIKMLGLDISWLDQAHALGIHFPDNLIYLPIYQFQSREEKEKTLFQILENLPAGVTELFFHPALESEDDLLRSATETENLADPSLVWKVRNWDYQILQSEKMTSILDKHKIKPIGFQPICDLMQYSK